MRYLSVLLLVVTTFLPCLKAQSAQRGDMILGKWASDQKMLTIEVYKAGNEYRAKIIDFKDDKNPLPPEEWTDKKNPNPKLRGRKVLGSDVMRKLKYNESSKNWSGGIVYNARSGKEYDASLELDGSGKLSVRAYKGFTFLGKTMTFHRHP